MINEEALRELQEEYESDHNKFEAAIRSLSRKDEEEEDELDDSNDQEA